MSLQDDLRKAISAGLAEVYPMHDDASFGETTHVIMKHVWSTLEDVVGSAQEALFQQLTAVRTELDASRRKEEALREIVRELSAWVEQHNPEESSDA